LSNLKYICSYELSFRLLSFLCYVIFDIDHLTLSPLSVLLIARMRDLLFFHNAFLFYALRLLSNSFLSYICILLVDNTSLGLFWTSPVHLPAHLTSSRRCLPPASQTRLFGCLFLTCSVEGTHVGYNDRSTDFDWMIESLTCFL